MSKPVRQGYTVFLSSIVQSRHHFSIENLLKALKSALATKHKKNSHFTLAAGSTHTSPDGLRKRWADSRPAVGGGRSPWRAKPVKINAHTKTKARAYKAQPRLVRIWLSGSSFQRPSCSWGTSQVMSKLKFPFSPTSNLPSPLLVQGQVQAYFNLSV